MPLNLDAAAATSLCQLELSSPHRHLREHTMHMVIAGLCVPFGANGGFHELKCTPSYHVGVGWNAFPMNVGTHGAPSSGGTHDTNP